MHVALIELYHSHDECLYSQMRFLKESGFTVHLICNAKLRSRVQDFDMVDYFYYLDFGDGGSWSGFLQVLKVRRYLLDNWIAIAVLNTARGSLIRNLLLISNRRTQFVGIGHIANKIFSGFTSWLIASKVKKYFVLNDYILPNLPRRKAIQVVSFYPVFFPPFQSIPLNKPPGEFWVCIPGAIELGRKDYDALLHGMMQQTLDPRVKFILLGRSNLDRSENKAFVRTIEENGLVHYFQWFEGFMERDRFFSYLEAADLILPLIHPKKPIYEEYIKYKISGAFNLAFGLGIPILCEESFKSFADFAVSSVFYSDGCLVAELNDLLKRNAELQQIKQNILDYPKFQFGYQKAKYIEFITSDLDVGTVR